MAPLSKAPRPASSCPSCALPFFSPPTKLAIASSFLVLLLLVLAMELRQVFVLPQRHLVLRVESLLENLSPSPSSISAAALRASPQPRRRREPQPSAAAAESARARADEAPAEQRSPVTAGKSVPAASIPASSSPSSSLYPSPAPPISSASNAIGGTVAPHIALAILGTSQDLILWRRLLSAMALRGSLEIFYVAWDADPGATEDGDSSINDEMGARVHVLFNPNETRTWTTSRNYLARAIYAREVERAARFDFWTFSDADMVTSRCDGCPVTSIHAGDASGGACCFDYFFGSALRHNFAVLGVYMNDNEVAALRARETVLGAQERLFVARDCGDANLQAFHRDAVPILLPYVTAMDNVSWWASQAVLFHVISGCLGNGGAVTARAFDLNNNHRDYPQGRDFGLETATARRAFPALVDVHFDAAQNPSYLCTRGGGYSYDPDPPSVFFALEEGESVQSSWAKSSLYAACKEALEPRFERAMKEGTSHALDLARRHVANEAAAFVDKGGGKGATPPLQTQLQTHAEGNTPPVVRVLAPIASSAKTTLIVTTLEGPVLVHSANRPSPERSGFAHDALFSIIGPDALPCITRSSWLTLQHLSASTHLVAFYNPRDLGMMSAAVSPLLVAGARVRVCSRSVIDASASAVEAACATEVLLPFPATKGSRITFYPLFDVGAAGEECRTKSGSFSDGSASSANPLCTPFGSWLNAHSSGRHVMLRALYAIGSIAMSTGAAPRPVSQRYFDAAERDLWPGDPQCAAISSLIAQFGQLDRLMYVRPGVELSNDLTSLLSTRALTRDEKNDATSPSARKPSVFVAASPTSILDEYVSCRQPHFQQAEGGDGTHSSNLPSISEALPLESPSRLRVDLRHPTLDRVRLRPVGVVVIDLAGDAGDGSRDSSGSTEGDVSLFSHLLLCVATEACALPRASLQTWPELRGDAILWAVHRYHFADPAGWDVPARGASDDHVSNILSASTICPPSSSLLKERFGRYDDDAVTYSCSSNSAGKDGGESTSTFALGVLEPPPHTAISSSVGRAAGPFSDGGGLCPLAASPEGRFAYRRWTPAWSGLPSPPRPSIAAAERRRATHAHLVQAQNAATAATLLANLDAPHTHIYLLCWDGSDCGSAWQITSGLRHGSLSSDRTRSLAPTEASTWSLGRNMLFDMALRGEANEGFLYEIIAFWDEDVEMVGYCDMNVTWPLVNREGDLLASGIDIRDAASFLERASSAPSCYRFWEAWTALVQSPVAVPILVPDFTCQRSAEATWSAAYNHDAYVNFLHRRIVDLLLPYDLFGERVNWIISQAINIKKLAAVYGDMVNPTLVRARNPEHKAKYNFDSGGPCEVPVPYVFEAGIVPPSMARYTAPAGCEPCALPSTGMGPDGHDFGTLKWVDRAWKLKEHLH